MSTDNAGAVSEHSPAAFINAIADEGTKAEAIQWLQRTWNDLVAARQQLAELQRERDNALPADDLRRALRDRLDAIEQENHKLRRELADYESSAKIQWECRMRAIKRWQEAHPGNDMRWPDGADLLVWLMEQVNG